MDHIRERDQAQVTAKVDCGCSEGEEREVESEGDGETRKFGTFNSDPIASNQPVTEIETQQLHVVYVVHKGFINQRTIGFRFFPSNCSRTHMYKV